MNNMFLKFVEALSKQNINMKDNYKAYRELQNNYLIYKFNKSEEVIENNILFRIYKPKKLTSHVIIYIHGGGWSTGNTKSYGVILQKLANELKKLVIAIEYRLAPECPFPMGFNDCYMGVKTIFNTAKKYKIKLNDAIIIGDSAGANLVAGVCLKAKKTKEFKINKQVLIYPIVQTNFKNNKKFKSIEKNGYQYFLTKNMINDYLELYLNNKKDYKNIYVAPLYAKWLFNMPDTLIITADLDPLRDEGYAYYKKLKKYGNTVKYYNMKGVIHGYFNNPLYFIEINKTIRLIKEFGVDNNDK